MKLTGKQKQFFKKAAHSLKPIFQIGKGGLSEEVVEQIRLAIEKRELIKINLLQNTEEEVDEVASRLEEAIGVTVIQTIGHTLVLYKKSSKEANQKLSQEFARAFQ